MGVVVMWGLLRARWMVDGGRRWVLGLGSFGDWCEVLYLYLWEYGIELSFHSCRYNAGNNTAQKRNERPGCAFRGNVSHNHSLTPHRLHASRVHSQPSSWVATPSPPSASASGAPARPGTFCRTVSPGTTSAPSGTVSTPRRQSRGPGRDRCAFAPVRAAQRVLGIRA